MPKKNTKGRRSRWEQPAQPTFERANSVFPQPLGPLSEPPLIGLGRCRSMQVDPKSPDHGSSNPPMNPPGVNLPGQSRPFLKRMSFWLGRMCQRLKKHPRKAFAVYLLFDLGTWPTFQYPATIAPPPLRSRARSSRRRGQLGVHAEWTKSSATGDGSARLSARCVSLSQALTCLLCFAHSHRSHSC